MSKDAKRNAFVFVVLLGLVSLFADTRGVLRCTGLLYSFILEPVSLSRCDRVPGKTRAVSGERRLSVRRLSQEWLPRR
jgi:hypothetical protein